MLSAAREAEMRQRRRRELLREREAYAAFYDQYDVLIGLLCGAAHEGVQTEMEAEYQQRRGWFFVNYPPLKRTLERFLPDDSDPNRAARRPGDCFEALYHPATIAEMLASDGGYLIPRLLQIQAALEGWETSLNERWNACL